MRSSNKVIAGIVSVAGVACTAGITAKVADVIKKKWFAQGYDAGHFVGFMDGGITIAQKYDNIVKTASELDKKHSVLSEKYNKLCNEYDDLECKCNELCEEYYES